MEKYGFVYIWRDRKHSRYYIGCHWGTEDDGYICSSRWMLQAYKRRSQDFKRRIISRGFNTRKDMLMEEFKWINLIPDSKLGKTYYNIKKFAPDFHWSSSELKIQAVGKKISTAFTEERRRRYSQRMKQANPMSDCAVVEKVRVKNLGRSSPLRGVPRSEETKAKQSATMKGRTAHNKGLPSKSRGIKRSKEVIDKHAKDYLVTDIRGVQHQIRNLAEFCKINNLTISLVYKAIVSGRAHKGYRFSRCQTDQT